MFRRRNRRAVPTIGMTSAFFLLLFTGSLFAQSPTPTPDDPDQPVRIKTDLVTLTLTVTDPYNRLVSGLKKSDFKISDNNQQQEIQFFSDTDAPVSVGILFDVSGSMNGDKIRKAQKALSRFIATSHPMDEYFLIAFNSRAQLLLDRTRDGDAVLRKLTLVKPAFDGCRASRVRRPKRRRRIALYL